MLLDLWRQHHPLLLHARMGRHAGITRARMSLIAELKRRNVFRVGAAYAIVGWLLVEVASVLLPTFEAPNWVMKVFTFLVILGFPLALVFAWAFELTPEGLKREAECAVQRPAAGSIARAPRRARAGWVSHRRPSRARSGDPRTRP